MNQFPELSIKKPEANSINRILEFNNNDESVMSKSQNKFNMDETGFSTNRLILLLQKDENVLVQSLHRAMYAISPTSVYVTSSFICP